MRSRGFAAILFLGHVPAIADVYSYECNSSPTEAGWVLLQAFCEPDEWVEGGILFHHVEFCEGFDPPAGQRFDYTRSLNDFLGVESFFVEWRLQTNGDSSELPFTAPAVFVIWNGGSVDYHLTIADDQLRFIRDNLLPILYPAIEPGIWHTFRLELYGSDLYVFFIDGRVIGLGSPEGRFPSFHPAINIGAKAKFVQSTTQWDYIRYGTIPTDTSGDFDTDADLDLDDFYFFHECLTSERIGLNGGPDADAGPGCRWADMSGGDGDVDLADFAGFQNLFEGAH